MTSVATVPVVEGLFQSDAQGVRLLGTRCASCGVHYFPKALSCRNPRCRDKQVGDALLGPRGVLYSYTVQSYQPPPLFRMEPWAPYAIGLVEIREGLRVMGMLVGLPNDAWRVGMTVEMTQGALYRNEQGQDVMTYQFRPVAQREVRA